MHTTSNQLIDNQKKFEIPSLLLQFVQHQHASESEEEREREREKKKQLVTNLEWECLVVCLSELEWSSRIVLEIQLKYSRGIKF
jgi:hypothetical protein